MTSRAATALACAVALAALAPRAARASAADAFENKVKPVSGQLYQKGGKLELTALGALSVDDAFFSKYQGGLKLAYHFNDYFALGVVGSFGTSSTTGSTSVCPLNKTCTPADAWRLYLLPGDIKWITGLELEFSPIYGKLNVFAEKALHFDLSLLGGADLVSYRDVLTAADAAPTTQGGKGLVPGNATSLGGHVGLGARVFFARFMALRLEIKDVIYSVPHLSSGNLQTQLMAEAGLSFFVPVVHRDDT